MPDTRTRIDIAQRVPDPMDSRLTIFNPALAKLKEPYIGASSMAGVMGENKRAAGYEQAYGSYLKFIGEAPEKKTNEAMRRGIELEDNCRQWAGEALGLTFKPICYSLDDEQGPLLWASLDGEAKEGPLFENKVVSAETHRFAVLKEVPPWYMVQCQTQLLVRDCDLLYYGSLHENTMDFQLVPVRPDPATQAEIRDTAERFREAVAKRLGWGDPEQEYAVPQVVDDESYIGLANRYKRTLERVEQALAFAGTSFKELETAKAELYNWAKTQGEGLYQPAGCNLAIRVSPKKAYTAEYKATLQARTVEV